MNIHFHLNADPAGKVLVAVEKAGRAVQSVASVIDGRTFLRRLVSGTKEDPLLGSCHLRAVDQALN